MEPQKPGKTRLAPLEATHETAPPIGYLSLLGGAERSWLVPDSHFLLGQSVRLGRSAIPDGDRANEILVLADSVSRFHASLARAEIGWVCRDEGSAGGTFVNDERVVSPRLLRAKSSRPGNSSALPVSWRAARHFLGR